MSANKIKNKKGIIITFSILALSILVVICIIYLSFKERVQERMYSERSESMQSYSFDAAKQVANILEKVQNQATGCSLMLGSADISTAKTLSVALNNMNQIVRAQDEVFYAFSDTHYFTSDNGAGEFHVDYSFDNINNFYLTTERLPGLDENKSYIICITEIPSAFAIDTDCIIDKFAVAIDISNLSYQLAFSGFDNENCVFLIDRDEKLLYSGTNNIGDYSVSDELISQISTQNFLFDISGDDFLNAVHTQKPIVLQSDIGETSYLISLAPIPTTNWSVLIFSPADSIGTDTNGIMQRSLMYLISIAGLMFLLIGALIILISARQNDKRIMILKEESNVLLSKAVDEANRANQAKSEFLSHMSHDIRTPINGIMGMTNIGLKNIYDTPRVEDCLHKIDSSSRHLLSLINDILDMSRIESGKVQITKASLNIRELLDNCCSIIKGQLASRSLKLSTNFDITHTAVLGDELHLRQIIINILGNAVKFTHDGGLIEFSAREVDSDPEGTWNMYEFTIRDTGIGMDEEFLTRIFEPFSQADNNVRTSYQGTGLGMAITKQFVDLLDGTITVSSTLGVGSTFVVTIPMNVDGSVHYSEPTDDSFILSLRGKKVLLVEDNELNVEVVSYELNEIGVDVTVATNGQEAVDAFTANPPGTFDLILMDIMMDIMDGITATKLIRSHKREDAMTIPIIALTANAYEEDIKKTKLAGMNAHLTKPISPPLLFRMIYNYTCVDYKQTNCLRLKGMHILLVEDIDLNAEVATELLKDEEILVTRVHNGKEACNLFESTPENTFDLILMDITMPVMNGLEAARYIRSLNRRDSKSIRIIAMTSNIFNEDIREAEEAGMDAHLSNPLEIGKLLETIKMLQ